jgi:hypothetical protein
VSGESIDEASEDIGDHGLVKAASVVGFSKSGWRWEDGKCEVVGVCSSLPVV